MTDIQKAFFIHELNETQKTDRETFEYYIDWFKSKQVDAVFGDDCSVVDLINKGTELDDLLDFARRLKS